jgi:hypothetical protein
MKTMLKKIRKNSERGQAIILIAFAIVGLVAIVGLMIDGGILLIEYARLKRGIDSASIAAASQFRKNFVADDLKTAGEEFLKFNQSDADVTIFTCDIPNTTHDATLCSNPPRKLVRITASRYVEFGFMRVVGMNGTRIEATSVGEAASVDLVLVIDTSSSMAYDTVDYNTIINGVKQDNDPASTIDPVNFPGDNVVVCNTQLPGSLGNGRCEPLGQIIDVAVNFVQDQLLFYPYDQVAIVASTEQTPGGNRNPVLVLPFNNNYNESTHTATTEIQSAIRSLRVFQPVLCGTPAAATDSLGGCVRFNEDTATYDKIGCDRYPAPGDTSACGSSNFGGSLRMAGAQFDTARQESFWVAIALIGGPATATDSVTGKPTGFCPPATWSASPALSTGRSCRDYDTNSINDGFIPTNFVWTDATRHNFTVDTSTDPDTVTFPANYDADDYARDAADYVTSRVSGQGATLYSICLGNLCRSQDATGTNIAPTRADPWSGDHLGEYIAEHSGDSANNNANSGLYRYSSTASGLSAIFSDIANNIFTRISQ